MKIVVVGSVALDSIKTPFGKVESILGGSATHFACAASLFTEVGLVGVVGNDFDQSHIDFLSERGIDVSGIERTNGETFRWSGYYDFDLNQAHTLETALNVFETFNPKLHDMHRTADMVFLANIDPELQLQVLGQMSEPRLSACDTMNYWIETKPEELEKTVGAVDICLMNDAEARQFCKSFSLVQSARHLIGLGPETVVFKKGEHGAVMFTDGTHFSAPAYPLEEVKDPTGAGDSFAGGFLGHLAKTGDLSEPNIRRAMVYGSVMASFNVEGFGAERVARLDPEEIEQRYREFVSITAFE